MRCFVVLLLMLVIVIEFVHSHEQDWTNKEAQDHPTEEERNALERLDVGFLPKAGDPALLNLLGFFLDQFLLDIGAHFRERLRAAAVFILDLQDIIIADVLDDVADS